MTPHLRAEGFAGQHLIVVPPPLVAAGTRHALLRGLQVTDCGYFPRALGHRMERPRGAGSDVLLVCLSGQGWVDDGRRLRVGPGEAAWLPAGRPHRYGASDDDPWSIEWVHLAGEEVPGWRTLLSGKGAGASVFPAALAAVPQLTAARTVLETGCGLRQRIQAAAGVRAALSGLGGAGHAPQDPAVPGVERVAAWMRHHLAERMTVTDLARRAGLSPSHFSTVFARRMGFPPIDYLLRQRILRAAALLETSPLKVAAVAAEVGFPDPYYFSRTFSRIMGHSPRAHVTGPTPTRK
jgi:AraC family transcriptional regulator, arabinose operon regulatory protein